MILILGTASDPHVATVCSALSNRGANFTLLDMFEGGGDGIDFAVAHGTRLVVNKPNAVGSVYSAVWWRLKALGKYPTRSLLEYYDHRFVQKEWTYLANYIELATEHLFAINDRARATRADNKILQLSIAEKVQLRTPDTLISNNVDEILQFISSGLGHETVFKTLTPYMSPDGKLTYTSVITENDIKENLPSIIAAPGIYQRRVDSQFEIRVNVVGDEIFATKILHAAKDGVDWRKDIFKGGQYANYEIDPDLSVKILAMHRKLGLFFGAYDFIVDTHGVPFFLEANPAGQWLWLERLLGQPISDRIALSLAQPPEYS